MIVYYPNSIVQFELDVFSSEILSYFELFFKETGFKEGLETLIITEKEKYVFLFKNSIYQCRDCTEAIITITGIIRQNLKFSCDWNAIHGSIIQIKSKNILFIGQTHAGKSTLAAYLSLQSDALIMSEDVSIINCKTLEFVCWPTPIFLRPKGADILANCYDCQLPEMDRAYNDKLIFRYPDSKNVDNVKLNACFLLNRIPEMKDPEIVPVLSEEKYAENFFLHHTMFYNIKCAVALYNKLPIYELRYENLKCLRQWLYIHF